MSFSMQETLFSLLQHNAIPGHENVVADVMLYKFRHQTKEVWRDRLGSVVAHHGGDKPDVLRLIIFAHMNEVGFMVRKIEPSGFLCFECVGDSTQVTMTGSIATFTGDKGPVMGRIGIKSYYLTKGDECTQSPSVGELWINIGARDRDDAIRVGIQVGTLVTLYNPPRSLVNDLVCSKALDDRPGRTALLGVADAISTTELDIIVYLVVSVQEEFNIRGTAPALRRVKLDLAIDIDIAPSCDTPNLHDCSEVRINQGVGVICLNYHGRGTLTGLVAPPRLMRVLEQATLEHNIPVQREVALGVITETGHIQAEQNGVPCTSLSIPCRYAHSPAEVTSLHDLTDCIRLLTTLADMSAAHFPVEPDSGTT